MYCWYCGTKLPGAALFCHRCGQRQDDSASYDPDAQPLVPDGWPWARSMPSDPVSAEAVESAAGSTEVGAAPLTVLVELPPANRSEAAPAAAVSGQAAGPSRIAGVLGMLCGLLVVAGSLGPWVTTQVFPREPIAIHGVEGDGRFTLWCGLAAVICLVALIASPRRGGLGVVAAGALFLAALIGIADWTNVSEHLGRLGPQTRLEAEIGWGLQAVTIGGLVGSLLAAIQALLARRIARAA